MHITFRAKESKPETLVPLCIERSIEMIIAIFGILKAGAAYVPIDPEYPEERMQFMLGRYSSNNSSDKQKYQIGFTRK